MDRRQAAIETTDALYHLRLAMKAGKVPPMVAMSMRDAEGVLERLLAAEGLDPGPRGDPGHADALKLRILRGEVGPVEREPETPAGPTIEDCLEKAQELDNGVDEFRELGRLQQFCMRARFPGVVEEDPILPVKTWLEQRGETVSSVAQAGRLFVEWTRDAANAFLVSRGMAPLEE